MGWAGDKLQQSNDSADNLLEIVNRYWLISGKQGSAWKQYFSVTIPHDIDSQTCIQLSAKIGTLLSEACGFLGETEAGDTGIQYLYHDQYNTIIDQLVQDAKNTNTKVPAAATLASLAEAKLDDLIGSKQRTEMCVKFWKRIIDGLKNAKSSLETITWNMSNEVKILGH